MSDLLLHAQLELLATLLEVETEEVAHLGHLGVDGIKELRAAISGRLFDGEAEMFARVSKLAPLVPDALVVKVAQAAVPPLVSGRLAGALGQAHRDRAVGLLKRMRADYLADAAPYVDPRAVAVLAPEFDDAPEALLPAAKVMLERKEYAAAASFLEFATPALVEAFSLGLDDIEALIEAVAYVDSDGQLSHVIRHVPADRIREIMLGNLDNEAGVMAALTVASRIEPDLTARIGDLLLLDATESQLAGLLRIVLDAGAADELLAVAEAASPQARERLKDLASDAAPAVAERLTV